MSENILTNLYADAVGELPQRIEHLGGAGSNRQYFRLYGRRTLIGVIGESHAENHAFITLARNFHSKGINVPEVIAVSDDEMAYLQTDFGDTLLFDAIAQGRTTGEFSARETHLLEEAMRSLAKIQHLGAEGLDFSACYPQPAFDRRTVHWDLNYFKYSFLKPSGIAFSESALEDDFEAMANDLVVLADKPTFMYRDFQSRNVMVAGDRLGFIDFQGGRRGPVHYDVASFLWQAKAAIPQHLREHLIDVYLDAASEFAPYDSTEFRQQLNLFVLFRMMQVLGAYGFRGLFERKQHFIDSIPPALSNIEAIMKGENAIFDQKYPEIVRILRELIKKYTQKSEKRTSLLVKVMSFSYKRGLPIDDSGNGGGFVFDCRGMHNPGRYDEYKKLTGRDLPVIAFLEERGEVQKFLSACYELVDATVTTYLRRGFTDLMVCFGCTGGQHRSVYCAEHMAVHLRETFGIDVQLIHREQDK